MNTHLKQLWAAMKLPKNFKKSYKFFCLGLDIRVTEIMHTDLLHTGFFTSSEHFMVQEMFGVREKPVVRLNLITLIHIGFQTISKCLWYRDNPVTFGCFRCPDNIFTIDSLEGFADGDGIIFQVYISRR